MQIGIRIVPHVAGLLVRSAPLVFDGVASREISKAIAARIGLHPAGSQLPQIRKGG